MKKFRMYYNDEKDVITIVRSRDFKRWSNRANAFEALCRCSVDRGMKIRWINEVLRETKVYSNAVRINDNDNDNNIFLFEFNSSYEFLEKILEYPEYLI